jgi:hypothetical protein
LWDRFQALLPDFSQLEHSFQVNCGRHTEVLQAAFGFSDIAAIAQAMINQFSQFPFDTRPQTIEFFELVGFLALARLAAEPLRKMKWSRYARFFCCERSE